MHMLIEGLQGVEAIADYFVIVGYGTQRSKLQQTMMNTWVLSYNSA